MFLTLSDNNVPNLKLPIVKAILQELNNFEDILRTKEQKLHTISEKSESQDNQENITMDNEREIIEEAEPSMNYSEYVNNRIQIFNKIIQYEFLSVAINVLFIFPNYLSEMHNIFNSRAYSWTINCI